MNIQVLVKDEILQDLNAKLLLAPALAPYIVSKMAGYANIKVAVPGILNGKVKGFSPRTGRTRRFGLTAIFHNDKSGFRASLWTPLFNIFTQGSKRGINRLPLIETLAADFESTNIAEEVITQALSDFDQNKLGDLSGMAALGVRRRKRRR